MSFRTSKCNHGDKGMCINCMVNKQKLEKNVKIQEEKVILSCKHPPHMKCLRCLPLSEQKSACNHPDYQKCKKCQHFLNYDKFSYFLDSMKNQCSHKKPCSKCVPPLSRKTYFIDKTCQRHMPYPHALCDACMAPTITVLPQRYAHVGRVVIKTTSVYRIADANMFGILLGQVVDDTVIIEDVYFPEEQQKGSKYINPEGILNKDELFGFFNLREVGLLYSSGEITGLSLMLSSLFQERYMSMEGDHQISKFITMRLQLQGNEPHFQCFMVSDQFQSFHKSSIIYEKETHDNYFDLITARKHQHLSELPTFLRQGIETDKIYFKEVLVWIQTIAQQNFNKQILSYPFYTIEDQMLQNLKLYIDLPDEPLQKYRNIQFLLHLYKLIGAESVNIFLKDFLYVDPQLFLRSKLQQLQKEQLQKLRKFQNLQQYNI